MKHSLLLLVILALGGCASLSENECRTADWESIGYIDGVSDKAENWISQALRSTRDNDVPNARAR